MFLPDNLHFRVKEVREQKWYSFLVPKCLRIENSSCPCSNCCCKLPNCMNDEDVNEQRFYDWLVPKCLRNKSCQCDCFKDHCKLLSCFKSEEEIKVQDENYIQERIRKAKEDNTLFPPDEM